MNEQFVQETIIKSKRAKMELKSLITSDKNKALKKVSDSLRKQIPEILNENKKDMKNAKENQISESMAERLFLDEKRIHSIADSVEYIISLPDPVGEVVRGLTLPNGIELITKRVPIGILFTIFESRPNVTVDVGALCFKSGNSCILKGGKEAIHTNRILSNLFRMGLSESNLNPDSVIFVDDTNRESILPFLRRNDLIDMVVPRGGEAMIRYVAENTSIPVVKHDKGVCNLYLDKDYDYTKSLNIIMNGKLQRPSVCNALENLIIHKEFIDIHKLLKDLLDKGVHLLIDSVLKDSFPNLPIATENDYASEFLDPRLAVKIVYNIEEAITFIEKYSSGHTEVILSNSIDSIEKFKSKIDSAGVYVNCSSRFHDGGEYGLGAEVGISTGKLHVRGPMGLLHLTTTTTYLSGNGQTRQ